MGRVAAICLAVPILERLGRPPARDGMTVLNEVLLQAEARGHIMRDTDPQTRALGIRRAHDTEHCWCLDLTTGHINIAATRPEDTP